MKHSSLIWLIIVVIIVVAGIWYWSSAGPGTTGNENPVASIPAPVTGTTVLDTATTGAFGTYLVAPNGMTLYEFAKDARGTSTCSGQCATIWPPYGASANETGPLLANGTGATGQVGTITRADGTLQITYNGLPLYFYSKDQAAGDVKGQNFAGLWSVVSPSGISSSSQNISGPGGRCGGNTTHPPTCAPGYRCVPTPSSTLPFGDVGGICAGIASGTSY